MFDLPQIKDFAFCLQQYRKKLSSILRRIASTNR